MFYEELLRRRAIFRHGPHEPMSMVAKIEDSGKYSFENTIFLILESEFFFMHSSSAFTIRQPRLASIFFFTLLMVQIFF